MENPHRTPETSRCCPTGLLMVLPRPGASRGVPRAPLHPWVACCPPSRVVMAACRVRVAATRVSPTSGDAGSPRQARSYFRHCPIWRLPEPKRRDLTAIPTPCCQQLLFKEGQRPDRLLTGHAAPIPHPEHSIPLANPPPIPPSCCCCVSKGPREAGMGPGTPQ